MRWGPHSGGAPLPAAWTRKETTSGKPAQPASTGTPNRFANTSSPWTSASAHACVTGSTRTIAGECHVGRSRVATSAPTSRYRLTNRWRQRGCPRRPVGWDCCSGSGVLDRLWRCRPSGQGPRARGAIQPVGHSLTNVAKSVLTRVASTSASSSSSTGSRGPRNASHSRRSRRSPPASCSRAAATWKCAWYQP